MFPALVDRAETQHVTSSRQGAITRNILEVGWPALAFRTVSILASSQAPPKSLSTELILVPVQQGRERGSEAAAIKM